MMSNRTASPSPARTFFLTLPVCCAIATLATPSTASDVVAHFRADGNCLDSAGGHHGAPVNGAGFGAGIAGQAFELNGSNQYVSAPDSPDWTFGDNPFTLSVWVFFDTVHQNSIGQLPNVFVGQDDGFGTQDKWVFFCDGAAQPWFHINGPASAFISPGFGPVGFTGMWHHYAVTRVGSTYTFYANGIFLGTATTAITIPDSSLGLSIGQAENLGFLDGRIDDVQIYNRALSFQEVNYLFDFPGNEVPANICASDLNGDTVVDGGDLGILLGQWGTCAGCSADFNADGLVDGADLGVLLGSWGPCS